MYQPCYNGRMARWVIGVDEAGRGPLAGPVAVGLVALPEGFSVAKAFPGVADSKKLSADAREALYTRIEQYAALGTLRFCARFSSARYIDTHGITRAVDRALVSGLRRLALPHQDAHIMLDGLLKAPSYYTQETIIRGDDLVPLISLASIVAKVRRDRLMRRLANEHPSWGFDQHKGYGTPAHYQAMEEWGLSAIHRRSFCKSFVESSFDNSVVGV